MNTGTASSNPGCGSLTNDEVALSLSPNGGLDIVLMNSTGGALITATCPSAGSACAAGSKGYDDELILGLNVTRATASAKTTVSSVSAAISGSDPGSGYSAPHISAGLSVTPPSQSRQSLTLYADSSSTAHPANYAASGSLSFSSVSSLSISADLQINLAGVPAGSTLRLTNVSQIIRPAPEPASAALLLVALGGVAAARRRRAKRPGDTGGQYP